MGSCVILKKLSCRPITNENMTANCDLGNNLSAFVYKYNWRRVNFQVSWISTLSKFQYESKLELTDLVLVNQKRKCFFKAGNWQSGALWALQTGYIIAAQVHAWSTISRSALLTQQACSPSTVRLFSPIKHYNQISDTGTIEHSCMFLVQLEIHRCGSAVWEHLHQCCYSNNATSLNNQTQLNCFESH